MIALAVLALLQAAPAQDDIVVIGRRLQAITVSMGRDASGKFTCDLSRSTGNASLDNRLCKASAACARKAGADAEAVKACVTASKPMLLAQLRKELRR